MYRINVWLYALCALTTANSVVALRRGKFCYLR
jgi:hypothetical protein